MDNNNVIIILLIVIIMLLIGLFVVNPFKEDVNIAVVSMDSLSVGDQFSIQLTDSKSNPVSGCDVDIEIKDSNGQVFSNTLTTDDGGNGALTLDEYPSGTYTVTCSINDNKYSASPATKTITINEKQQTTSSQSSGLSDDGYSYYPEYGPSVDSRGQTREQAIANNWHYIPQTIDGVDCGIYVPYDSKAGCYHT